MPVYAYVRVSTGRQDHENQRFEILKFADQRKWIIEEWCEETVSGTKRYTDRALGPFLDKLEKGDTLIVTEISRLGRSLMGIMTILNLLLEHEVQVFTCKEQFELGDNINAKILAFAFGLAAEIERQLISQRTKESLALLHSHTCFFRGGPKHMRCFHLGNVNECGLAEIWGGLEYRGFRKRVREFDFAPCFDCGGCELRESNEEDCFGDQFPRCGECLWAHGLVKCP